MGTSYNMAVVPGDGTGPEVVAEGFKVLCASAGAENIKLNFTRYDIGGERYLETGDILPDSVREAWGSRRAERHSLSR